MKHRVAHSNFGGEFCLLVDSAMRSKCRSIQGRKNHARCSNFSPHLRMQGQRYCRYRSF
ncbi:unnamed protein product [Musa acuminata subsp. malaccensis]|uniref:(wild Malaysian banana) hypothetical protein n=1 Tax=Musa acuminata subsp. malaccensis TaxID=214687 RepID=A0A804L9W6_MUSAM|nr:unnamed protein product [Musa acuminata subsp. malaccensis]